MVRTSVSSYNDRGTLIISGNCSIIEWGKAQGTTTPSSSARAFIKVSGSSTSPWVTSLSKGNSACWVSLSMSPYDTD